MNQYSGWRYVFLAVCIVLGILFALPNLYGSSPAIQITEKNQTPFPAGFSEQISQALSREQISPESITVSNNNALVRFSDSLVQFKAEDALQTALGDNYVVAANLAPNTPHWLQAFGAVPMRLGLDLQGGIHFLLAVDVNAMVKEHEQGDVRSMVDVLRNQQIHYSEIGLPKRSHAIAIIFSNVKEANAGLNTLQDHFSDYQFIVKDQGSRALLIAKMTPNALIQIENYAVDQNINTLRNRVNALGVAEPVIQRQGATQISVDLPGIQDTARAKDLIGKVATVRMQLQDTDHDPLAAQNGIVPFGSQLYSYEDHPVLLKQQVILRGSSIIDATPSIDQNGRPAVSIRLNGEGASFFNQMTASNIGKPLAVVYVETKAEKSMKNGKTILKHKQVESVINIATIQSALGNDFQIMGLSSQEEAQNLALLLRSGAYSAPVDFVEERLVGPSLGQANIHMGIMSVEVGALFVILFMAFYYRFFGLVADLALLLNLVFIIAILSLLSATLTLPGIAGIVLTVGMAVDANVLVNERIREELRLGMSAHAAIRAGYDRAFATIVDANVSTLIVALVLFALGTGSVQAFAITLIIGLLTSMFTAIFFTRTIINLIYGRRSVKHLSIGIRVSP